MNQASNTLISASGKAQTGPNPNRLVATVLIKVRKAAARKCWARGRARNSAEAIAVPSHTNASPPVKRVQKIVQRVTARKSVP